ncbi:MAG: thioredoxin family protein [Crocinitomicaceae bacterium]|jgi:protein disulfide-isomerase
MKKIFLFAFSFVLFVANSQKDELTWHTDLNKATSIAQKEKKPLMLFFTGSDWCGWCHKLQKEVFFQDEFKKWAKDNVVLLEVDFPSRNGEAAQKQSAEVKQQNNLLQQQFSVRGYPTVWFVKPEKTKEGKVNLTQLGQTGYVAGGAQNWVDGATSIINSK